MATRLFSDAHLEQLRSFPDTDRDQLIRFFTLTPADVAFIDPGRGRGPADRLGLAVQLCTLPWLGFVPDEVTAAPGAAVHRLAERLQVDSHARLVRRDELSAERAIRQADERNYISDTDLARMLQYAELLGLPRDQAMTITRDGQETDVAGLGHPAMMRAWLIQALTGRRAAEVLLMDFDPLSPIPAATSTGR